MIPLAVLSDNYAYVVVDDTSRSAVVVDPSDPDAVKVEEHGLVLVVCVHMRVRACACACVCVHACVCVCVCDSFILFACRSVFRRGISH